MIFRFCFYISIVYLFIYFIVNLRYFLLARECLQETDAISLDIVH